MAGAALLRVTGVSGLPFYNALSTTVSLLSDGDLTGIGELSILDMRTWSSAKADEHHRRALIFNAIQNILAPVHRLPPEILSRIFVEAWHDRKSLRLTHVCRLWRTILLETSQFWAVAIAGDEFRLSSDDSEVSDEDYLDAACRRSAPRNISFHLPSMSTRGNLKLVRYVDRITSMEVSTRTDDQLVLLWKMLHAGMPRLENLTIRGYPLTIARDPVEFSMENLPTLTRLTLPTSLFFLSSHPTRGSWPSTLRELAIVSNPTPHWHANFGVPGMEVLKALTYYPMLTVLDIRDDMLVHDALFNNLRSRPSSLAFPALQLLRIELRPEMVSAILSLLSFSPSTRVDIKVAFWPRPEEGDLFVPGSVLDGLAALVDQVAIENGLLTTVHGYTDGAERLRIRVLSEGVNRPQIGRILCLFTRTNAPVSRAHLTLHPPEHVLFTGHHMFPAFPHLTHLVLHGCNVVCTELLVALCPPCAPSSASESVTPLLPLLKDLTVGVTIKCRSKVAKELRRVGINIARPGDDGEVFTHFRDCCKLLFGVLDARAQRDYRLSRLEFFSYEGMTKPWQTVSHVDLTALGCNSVECELKPLRRLVDGPVVFSGYRLLVRAQYFK